MSLNLNINPKNHRKRFNITFRETEQEEKLYNWVKEKSQINGVSAFIKQELYKLMIEEEKKD